MKKTLLAAVCFTFISLATSAQLFVGTGFGLGFGGGNNSSNFNFNFGPEVGYELNDKLDLGIKLDLGLDNRKIAGVKSNTTSWEVAPFIRYSVYEYEGVELLGRASIFVGGANNSTHFGLNVVPMVVYNLTDKIELQAVIEFLTLDFRIRDSYTSFGLGVETRAASPISFGFAYKF